MMPLRPPTFTVRRLIHGVALGVLLWGLLLPVASAQQARTLDIRDGTVYVDGRPLADEQLPADLDLEGIEAQYRFVGVQRPVIELNDRLYAIDDGLEPVTEEEVQGENASVILRGNTIRSSSRVSSDTPETDYRQYLSEVERSSRQLYERLVRERQMERDAQELARVIRLLPEGTERQQKTDTLRSMLNEIFELKQENRRREIERLQQKIQELQESIQEREQMREAMIDRRLQQLIGASQDQ